MHTSSSGFSLFFFSFTFFETKKNETEFSNLMKLFYLSDTDLYIINNEYLIYIMKGKDFYILFLDISGELAKKRYEICSLILINKSKMYS